MTRLKQHQARRRALWVGLATVGVVSVTGCGDGLTQVRADAGHLPIPDTRPGEAEPYEVVEVSGPQGLVLSGAVGQVEVVLVGVTDVDVDVPRPERRVPGSSRDEDEEDAATEAADRVHECATETAKAELVSMVTGETVYPEFVSETGADGAEGGAPLVYLWVGNDLVNVELLKAGVQDVEAGEGGPFSRQSAFRQVAGEAKSTEVGLFEPGACGSPVEEADGE